MSSRLESYRNYLEDWNDRFGEEVKRAPVTVFQNGKQYTYYINKLNWRTFNKTLNAYGACNKAYYQAQIKNDVAGMRQALKDGFPYELSLLM